jgi:hypothetical protein
MHVRTGADSSPGWWWRRFAGKGRGRAPARGAGGFTIIEMVVALSLLATLFTALAVLMGSSLRTLSATRGRGQANEIAAQGIEDLQRFTFSSLVLCNTPTVPPGGSVPTGFASLTTVMAASCANAQLEAPCPTSTMTGLTGYPVARANYTCARYGLNYAVSRYISWADSSQTTKRLAVVVNWTDQAGNHEVAQQSSVRAPDQGAIVGANPPTLTSAATNPSTVWVDAFGYVVTASGAPQSISLTVNVAGLASTDQVSAYFVAEDPVTHVQTTATVQLTSTGGSLWTGSIPGSGTVGAPTFPTAGGTQYIGFTAIRKSDGKANSVLSAPPITFCNNPSAGNSGSCSINAGAPSIPSIGLSSTTVPLNPDGTLFGTATFTITATTSNVYASTTAADSVVAVLQTQAGASQIALKPNCTLTSSLLACNSWKVTLDSTMALRFAAGPQYVYVIASQVVTAPYATAAAQSSQQVSFQ